MIRLLMLSVLLISSNALAQAKPEPEAAPTPPPSEGERPAARGEREQIKREVMDDVRKELERQKDEIRDEVRAQVATQAANRALEEEFQTVEQRKKLELLELDGYFRVRPVLYQNLDLNRGADPTGRTLFPRAGSAAGLEPNKGADSLADVNMRWRIEPTLNVSEDVRLYAQIDVLDNLVFGSTPEGGFGLLNTRSQFGVLNETQVPASLKDTILVRRVYGEVVTPVGQLLFGRMGSQWGLGMLTSSGNCVDCDFGDTVDRFMFVTKVAEDYYVVPMLDFVSEGQTGTSFASQLGSPYDVDQLDDARQYGLAIARRDSPLETERKLNAGQSIFNYGLYFTYRTQTWDSVSGVGLAPGVLGGDLGAIGGLGTTGFVPRNADIYTPDLWAKYQTRKLKLELETAFVWGKIGNAAPASGLPAEENRALTVQQVGAVAQGSYSVLDSLDLGLEFGFASGDRSPGMGVKSALGSSPTQPGTLDGPQFCLSAACASRDDRIQNFRFNRDYRVDLILWRELFGGITDAIYLKPGIVYQLTEGFDLWANIIYSRAVYGESTPSSHLDGTSVTGDPNLGVEVDGGFRYDSGDGFAAGVAYGVLFPLAGLNSVLPSGTLEAGTAHALRGWFVVKY